MNALRKFEECVVSGLMTLDEAWVNKKRKDCLTLIKSIIEDHEIEEYNQKTIEELYSSLRRFTFEPLRIPEEKIKDVQKILTSKHIRYLVKENYQTPVQVTYFKKKEPESVIFQDFFNQELKNNKKGLRIKLSIQASALELPDIKNYGGYFCLPTFEIFNAQNNVVITRLFKRTRAQADENFYFNACMLANQEGIIPRMRIQKIAMDCFFTQLQNIICTTIFHLRNQAESLEFYYAATIKLDLSNFGWQYKGTATNNENQTEHLYHFKYNEQDVVGRTHQVSLAFGLGHYLDAREEIYLPKSAKTVF